MIVNPGPDSVDLSDNSPDMDVQIWQQRKANKRTHWFVRSSTDLGSFSTDIVSVPPSRVPEGAWLVPFRRIRTIEAPLTDNRLLVHYDKQSKFEYAFGEQTTRDEVFQSLREHVAGGTYERATDGLLATIKRPLFALLILGVLIGMAFHTAVLLEQGEGVEQFVVVLLLAGLGSTVVVGIGAVILCIIAVRIGWLLKKRAPVDRLSFR